MKKWILIAALAMLASPASAQWKMEQQVTRDKNIPLCTMRTAPGGHDVRLIKYGDDARYYVNIVSALLGTTANASYVVLANIDGGRTFRFNSISARGDGGLLITLSVADFDAFLADMRVGKKLNLDLTSTGQPNWSVDLAGNASAADEFRRCVQRIGKQ